MIDDSLVLRPLFGGAAQMSIPQRFTDISDFRPIPDNQEVFADGSLDQSLVVEIVEHQQGVPDAEAGAFYLQDLAQHNDAAHAQIDSVQPLAAPEMPGVPAEAYKVLAAGQQAVSKGRQGQEALNKVQLLMCVVRLQQHKSDVLITLNTPIWISEHSAAAEHAGAGFKGAHLIAPDLFRRMLATFQILDYGLFGA